MRYFRVAIMEYKISRTGIVTNRYNKELKPSTNPNGYYQLGLCKNGVSYTVNIHRLLAEAYIPNPENKPEVNHIDKDRKNNSINNLEWVTHAENLQHSAKLDKSKVQAIRNACAAGYKQKDIAKDFNISTSHVSNIYNKRNWK